MTKPSNMNESYSDIGGDIHEAGVYGNVVHNLTQGPDGKITAWFSKRKGQYRDGVAQWMVDFFKQAGADICIVDYDRSGTKPIAVTFSNKNTKATMTATTRPKLHEVIRSRGTLR